jgi:hypothetical protein
MEPHPAPARPRARRRPRLGALLAAVVVAALAAGCGVRLETPPPAEPVPDALEVVRRTAVADALVVAEQAGAVAAVTAAGEIRTELERVAQASLAHADQLGGVYESGLEDPAASASAPVSPEASPSATPVAPEEVVATLTDAAARSRSAASTTTDGPLARLLASVGASQTVSATRLARLVGAEPPTPVTPLVPMPDDGTGVTGTPSATPSADGAAASPSPSPSPSPSDGATPEGLTAADLSAVVAAEDSAGYALRRRAALAGEDLRGPLLARAETHLERAEAWALFAGTDGTDQDPRRAAYAVPDPAEADDATLARTLEADLAADYASLVGRAAPGTRSVLVDLLVDAALAVDAWGGAPSAFPGLPEQAGG